MPKSGTRLSEIKGFFSAPTFQRVCVDDPKSAFNGRAAEVIGAPQTAKYKIWFVAREDGDVQLFIDRQLVLE